MLLPILVNARWQTPSGLIAVITTSDVPGCVDVALLRGREVVGAMTVAGTAEQVAETCTRAYTYLGPFADTDVREIVPIETIDDLAALDALGEAEAMHTLTTGTMPRRSMS